MVNLASSVAGVGVSGVIYFKAFKRRYLQPIGYERDLLNKNLSDIKKYREYELSSI